MINIPILTPRLSSYWVALVTRVDLEMVKELVEGVRFDLDPAEAILWDHVDHVPMSIAAGAQLALDDETSSSVPSRSGLLRVRAIGMEFAASSK